MMFYMWPMRQITAGRGRQMDIEIAPGKRARQAYSFDDIAIVPSRRTRYPEDVSTAWQIDAYKFELTLLAAPMDSVV